MSPSEPTESFWALDPDVLHLNHGSFGAAPKPVLAAQQRWRAELEANPVRFMEERMGPALDQARAGLSEFVGADPDGLAFVGNATAGVNAVLRSLEPELGAGDEIVVTNHGYNACCNAAEVTAGRTGARLRVAEVPFPATSAEVTAAVLAAVGPRTRLVLVDHVTSPTAAVFPVEDIVAELEPDVSVLVDGAHAPGMLPLGIEFIGATYYTGNCHKWLCAPKGAGFLVVRPERRDTTVPPVVSHGWNRRWEGRTRYQAMFDWTGTQDPSAWLAVPDAIEAIGTTYGGWERVRAANHELVVAGRDLIEDLLGLDPGLPAEMLGSMAAIPLPPGIAEPGAIDPLTARLRHEHAIEVPVLTWPDTPHRLLRISAQRYNQLDDYDRLAGALVDLL